MVEQTEAARGDEMPASPGARVAAAVRGAGAGAADLTETAGRAGVSALAATVRSLTSMWGTVLGMTVDAAAAGLPRRPRRALPNGSGPQRCIDLTEARTGEQIDQALAGGLSAAAPRRRTAVME